MGPDPQQEQRFLPQQMAPNAEMLEAQSCDELCENDVFDASQSCETADEENCVQSLLDLKQTCIPDDENANQKKGIPMEVPSMKNVYMEQAMHQAQDLEKELQVKRSPKVLSKARQRAAVPGNTPHENAEHDSVHSNMLGVRISGWWRWKTVIVPPNVYVVHTRRGYKKPLHTGLGVSFRYKSHIDSFLVIPSAMQTIIINANSICKELQGILIQAYVQWIIDNVETAYQRLDFSDTEDPMRVVNVQLREQAEAAIKDKVATMSIREVLSDKQPIIKELTKRLKEVAEGSGDDRGLGIRIVTVQIKEAIVSSAELWQNLQKPFRASQKTAGRLAEIENDSQVTGRELEEKKVRETSELETKSALDKLRAQKQSEEFDRQHIEANRRHELEQQAKQKQEEADIESQQRIYTLRKDQELSAKRNEAELATEACKLEENVMATRHALEMQRMEQQYENQKRQAILEAAVKAEILGAQLERDRKSNEARNEQMEKDIAFDEKRQKIANMLSAEFVQAKAMDAIPKIAQALPKPQTLHAVNISGDSGNTLTGMVAGILGVLQNYGIEFSRKVESSPQK